MGGGYNAVTPKKETPVIEFEKIQSFRDKTLFESKGDYLSDIQDYDSRFAEIKNGMMGNNKFLTEYNFKQKEIVNKVNIFNCLGYEDDEFTIQAINNSKDFAIHIIYEEDIKHKIRYDNITYALTTQKYIFKSLRDYYKLCFRVKHKNGDILKVERSTYFFRISSDGKPLSQIDRWEVSQNSSPFVILSYYTPNYKEMIKDFYDLNAQKLKLKFTPREKEILVLKNKQLNNKEIQEELNTKSIRTVEKHIENILKKTKISFLERGEVVQINSIREVLYHSKKYGLFPFY